MVLVVSVASDTGGAGRGTPTAGPGPGGKHSLPERKGPTTPWSATLLAETTAEKVQGGKPTSARDSANPCSTTPAVSADVRVLSLGLVTQAVPTSCLGSSKCSRSATKRHVSVHAAVHALRGGVAVLC